MKPLHAKDLHAFLQRFEAFKESEIREFTLISPTEMHITLTAQDGARAFDWLTITLAFSQVEDAKLLGDNQLNFIDTNDGICLIHEDGKFAFAPEACYNTSNVKNAPFYILSKGLKYQEGPF
ncbi:hypothetical protein [Sulfurimonas sp.]